MRKKTSLTFDETTMPLARARAKAEGLDISRWVERAILNEAARGEVDLIEAWAATVDEDTKAAVAALEALDGSTLG